MIYVLNTADLAFLPQSYECILKVTLCCFVQSCENRVVLWKPGSHTSELHSLGSKPSPAEGTAVSVIHQFDFAHCDIWFMRFAMDHGQKVCVYVCTYLFVCDLVLSVGIVQTNF